MTRITRSVVHALRVLLILSALTLTACASSPQRAGGGGPGVHPPCARTQAGGFWRCVTTRRSAWFESRRQRTRAWLGTRASR